MAAIIVHGGAGKFKAGTGERARKGCRSAAEAGFALLQQGASALDAVERAVQVLEDDPTFNAGTGAHPNAAGSIEMDAILVDGATLDFGAVAGLQNTRHPISVARKVLEETAHCFLAGEGATQFARRINLHDLRPIALGDSTAGPEHDTVGAAAMDAQGTISAATSTGGTRNKMPGRVGDSPLIGCGASADNAVGGASATGHGESLMKVTMAQTTLGFLAQGRSPDEAAAAAVAILQSRVQGKGGVICIDPLGRTGFARNTTHLALASIDVHGTLCVAL